MTEERKNEIISLLGYLAMLDIASDEMAQRGIKYSEVMEFLDELAFPDDTFKMRVSELAKKYHISHQRDIDWHNFVAEVEELTRPELAEWSEEERIRKWLLECVESLPNDIFIEVNKQDVLFYLEKQEDLDKMIVVSPEVWDKAINDAYENGEKEGEKQNEQKPAQTIEEKEYVHTLKSLIADFVRANNYIERGYYQQIYDWLDGRHVEQKPKLYWHKIKAYEKLPCKAYLYKQAFEQENNFFGKATIPGFMAPNIPCKVGCDTWYLPVDDVKNLPKEGEDEQRPAEWDEEDENMRWNVISIVGESKSVQAEEMMDWLKSLPLNLKKKNEDVAKLCSNEWSEEDEKKIHFLSRLIEFQVKDDEYCFGDGRLISKQEAIEMLKSLRSHPKSSDNWKPSEEQIQSLKQARDYYMSGRIKYVGRHLSEIAEQLEKLM